MSEATQQMIKLPQGDLCKILSQILRKSHISKSISESKASGFDPINVRWTESEPHLQFWRLRTVVQQWWFSHEGECTDTTNGRKTVDAKRATTPRYWADGRTTNCTELVRSRSGGLGRTSSIQILKLTNHQQVLSYAFNKTRQRCTSISVTFEDKTA